MFTRIVKDYIRPGKSLGDAEAKEIYTDILLPQLQNLETEARNRIRSLIKRAVLKTTTSSALLAFGILGGVLPIQIAQLIKAVGGFSLARDIAEAVAAIERNPSEIRNHNLYFLLRLKQRRA